MSCWVVPAIAAELWGVTLGHVLERVRDGSLSSRHEHGFTFVDVAPDSHTYHRPRRPGEPAPPTFVAAKPREDDPVASVPTVAVDDTLDFGPAGELIALSPPVAWIEPPAFEDAAFDDAPPADELPPLDEEDDAIPLPPRDAIRAAVARQRRRPLAA